MSQTMIILYAQNDNDLTETLLYNVTTHLFQNSLSRTMVDDLPNKKRKLSSPSDDIDDDNNEPHSSPTIAAPEAVVGEGSSSPAEPAVASSVPVASNSNSHDPDLSQEFRLLQD